MLCNSSAIKGSNNTNKLSPQELKQSLITFPTRSNNTNKLSPQEHCLDFLHTQIVQIIQINLVLKNWCDCSAV